MSSTSGFLPLFGPCRTRPRRAGAVAPLKYSGFVWDEANTRKLAAHDLTPEDIEALFDERFVLVVFEHHRETRWVRVVTAHEAEHERWWKI